MMNQKRHNPRQHDVRRDAPHMSTDIYVPTMVSKKVVLPITAIDSTGAGDAFAAGFIGRWIESKDLESSLRAGNSLASGCVTTIGARPSVNPK